MTTLEALMLGLVQGLTEFLPISSSAHLVFFQNLFGITEPVLFFDVMLHLGTLLSIIVFFRKDLLLIINSLRGRQPAAPDIDRPAPKSWVGSKQEAWRYVLWIIIATIPAGAAGMLLNDVVETAFGSMRAAAAFLLVTGALLFVAGKKKPGKLEAQKLSPAGALLIGLGQMVALLPGISRSGSTICASLFVGLNRDAAARFSFLVAIPAILGAVVLELGKAIGEPVAWLPTIAGAAVAFISGILALALVIGALRKGRLGYFAYYCWAAGLFFVILSFFR